MAQAGSWLPTFQVKLMFPSSTVKQSKKNWTAWLLRMALMVCPITLVTNNQHKPCNVIAKASSVLYLHMCECKLQHVKLYSLSYISSPLSW